LSLVDIAIGDTGEKDISDLVKDIVKCRGYLRPRRRQRGHSAAKVSHEIEMSFLIWHSRKWLDERVEAMSYIYIGECVRLKMEESKKKKKEGNEAV